MNPLSMPQSRRWFIRAGSVLAVGVLAIALLVAAPPNAEAQPSVAPGAPGSLSHLDLARKDCLGTARNTTSKIWYTVADGGSPTPTRLLPAPEPASQRIPVIVLHTGRGPIAWQGPLLDPPLRSADRGYHHNRQDGRPSRPQLQPLVLPQPSQT